MKVKFDNSYGEMELENNIRSIFDENVAGQIATDGEYYCIHFDHKSHQMYALTKAAEDTARALGHPLGEGEEAIFHGARVRGMTLAEERAYNEDSLCILVDLWGNIAVSED